MKKLLTLAFLVVLIALIVSCATPTPTPVPPTKAPEPTKAPAQPTAAPQPTKAPEPTKAPAALDGAALLQERCASCHNLDRVKSATKSKDQWTATVERMISKGAKLNDAEKSALIEYLAKTYGGAAAPAEPIKIGFFSPLTGPTAADGQSALNAAKLAVKFINDAGGINGRKLELINYDDAGKTDQAASVARKLIESDKVVAAISGAYSGPTRAAAPVFQQAGVVMLSAYAIHPDITKTGDKIFRIGTLATIQGRVGAELVAKNLKAKKVAILTIDNDFGVSLTAGFKEQAAKLGLEIVFEQKYPFGEKDFRPIIEKMKPLNPDAVYATGYFAEAAQLVAQAKDAGFKAQIVGQEGYDSPQFIKLAGANAEGVIITTDLNRDSKEPMTQKFLTEYKKAYNEDADMVGASAFDAVQVLAYALKQGTTTEAIQKAILGLKDFKDCATGPFLYYDASRELVRPVSSQIVKNGKFTFYAEFTDAKLIAP
jgi:branched-chain amino acid transport system substrate-binding protein